MRFRRAKEEHTSVREGRTCRNERFARYLPSRDPSLPEPACIKTVELPSESFFQGGYQRCHVAPGIEGRLPRLPAYPALKAFVFRWREVNELDAPPVQQSLQSAPNKKAVFFPVEALLEPDNARLDPLFGRYSNAGGADIHDPGKVIPCPGILKSDDPQGAVSFQGDRVAF